LDGGHRRLRPHSNSARERSNPASGIQLSAFLTGRATHVVRLTGVLIIALTCFPISAAPIHVCSTRVLPSWRTVATTRGAQLCLAPRKTGSSSPTRVADRSDHRPWRPARFPRDLSHNAAYQYSAWSGANDAKAARGDRRKKVSQIDPPGCVSTIGCRDDEWGGGRPLLFE